MGTAFAAAYLLIVTVVTPGQIKEAPFPPGGAGYEELSMCLDDLAFYKARWPHTPDTDVYFRCHELQGAK
jgi:hypothetical protein